MKNRLMLVLLSSAVALLGCGKTDEKKPTDAVSQLLKDKVDAANKDKEQVAKRERTSTRLRSLVYDAKTGTYVEQK